MVCAACRTWLDGILADIAELTPQLAGALIPGQGGAREHVSGSPESPLPLQIAPLDLGMPARALRLSTAGLAARDDQTGDLSVASILDGWVRDWRSYLYRERLPRPTVDRQTRWLRDRLDWACDQHPAIDECADELRALRAKLAGVLFGRSDRRVIGDCPVDLDNGRQCGAPLSADPFLDVIQCRRCLTQWDRREWLWLGTVLRATQSADEEVSAA